MNFPALLRFAFLGLLGLSTARSLPPDANPAAGPIPAPADGKAAPDRKVVPPAANRVLRPNDLIRVEVAGEPDLSCDSRIRKTGEAALPLVGRVKIAGLSVKAAAAKIRHLYAKDILNDPKVTLSIRAFAPRR
jgi:polysaccharide export outer membrane protein